ncbi:hypothetical protein IPM09_04595 [Candidatus Saccharibacteria bacterium]|nr:MAG: hypothetical protein IPM09_04595 [Candidatus Saccharibacteria bacterium]
MTTTVIETISKTKNESTPDLSFELSEEALETLRQLLRSNRSMFDERLDDITSSYLMKYNPEFALNIQRMRMAREESAQLAIKHSQEQLVADTRARIAEKYDLPTLSEFEESKQRVLHVLNETGCQSALEAPVLTKLGIIVSQNNNRWHHYPYGSFPRTVDEAWCRYLRAADEHEKYASLLKKGRGEGLTALVMEKDQSRRSAHNAVATQLCDLLGLTNLQDARELATSMRDHAPIAHGANDTKPNSLAPGMTIARAMHHHLLADYDSLPDPERPRHF